MHPVILSQLAAARIADRQHQAERSAIAWAAGRVHGSRAPRPLRLAALVRHARTPLAVRSRVARAWFRPSAACPPVACCADCT